MAIEKADADCVLVGLQMDDDGKDLLNWALINVAAAGDRIVAVHVRRKSEASKTSTLSLIRVLDDYLMRHEALCSKKQVVLVGKVVLGSSIQKALVKEAELCAAKTLVVGVNKKFSLIGSNSLAKYCSKKLPATTSIFAVHSNRVIFHREAVVIKSPLPVAAETFGGSKEENSGNMKESPGWPLLRRPPVDFNNPAINEARKIPVVKWAMSLPKRSATMLPLSLAPELEMILRRNSSKCKRFSHHELLSATNNFSPENLIGKGGSSQVYRGVLGNGREVAIKMSAGSSDEVLKNFLQEVDVITALQHERIMPLIGICIEGNRLFSVYNYLSQGSLEEYLHAGKRSKTPLSWDKRYKVAVGVAEALEYLHCGGSRPVIHRDVKSSNILLTDEFEPQLSDFELAIWAPSASTSPTNRDVVGTFGYLAPEYFMYGKVSEKLDLYAFGVVLLELLTGRKPISGADSPKGQESLVMWAMPILSCGGMTEFLDRDLKGEYDEVQMRRMVVASALCLKRAAHLRPDICQILGLLRGNGDDDLHVRSTAENDSCVVTNEDDDDDEAYLNSSFSSNMGLVLLDGNDDMSISDQSDRSSLEEYLRERWSRSSSFD